MWPACGACTVGLFEYLNTLILICAQSGGVSGLEKTTDPASSSRSDKKGLKDNNNRLLGIVKSFVSLLVLKVRYYSVGGSGAFCQSGRVPILPIRKGTNLANPEGSCFCQLKSKSFWEK